MFTITTTTSSSSSSSSSSSFSSSSSSFSSSSSSRDREGLLAQCELVQEMLQDLAHMFPQQQDGAEGKGQRVGRAALELAVAAVKEQTAALKSEVRLLRKVSSQSCT